MKVYMKVTRDRLELPIYVADTISELARMTDSNEGVIRSSLSHMKSGRNKNSVYREIEIGELEDEEKGEIK